VSAPGERPVLHVLAANHNIRLCARLVSTVWLWFLFSNSFSVKTGGDRMAAVLLARQHPRHGVAGALSGNSHQ
jgi:hypothetical protein